MSTSNTTNTISSYSYQSDPVLKFFVGFVIFIGVLGTLANGFVLFILLYHRKTRGNTTNVFICNQTLLDLLACFFVVVSVSMRTAGLFNYEAGVGGWLMCYLFETGTLIMVATDASVYGLVVITIERYFKICHPIGHRKNYRRWMMYVGRASL
jgi:hypothetical protein